MHGTICNLSGDNKYETVQSLVSERANRSVEVVQTCTKVMMECFPPSFVC